MQLFNVTGLRAEIVRPGKNLTAWAAEHQPFAVCNASLYTAAREPIGTIIEDGAMVHNDGNGFGCGVSVRGGCLGFGMPWGQAWTDYITGYNAPVQQGKYVAPAFADSYVFGCRLARIGVGRAAGKTLIVTDDYVTLQEFAQHAIAAGFDTLVNLDGGGSRHLFYDGKTVYTSGRIPYNAIAFYATEGPENDPVGEPGENGHAAVFRWACEQGMLTGGVDDPVTKGDLAAALKAMDERIRSESDTK